jgi:hypothetical protein
MCVSWRIRRSLCRCRRCHRWSQTRTRFTIATSFGAAISNNLSVIVVIITLAYQSLISSTFHAEPLTILEFHLQPTMSLDHVIGIIVTAETARNGTIDMNLGHLTKFYPTRFKSFEQIVTIPCFLYYSYCILGIGSNKGVIKVVATCTI